MHLDYSRLKADNSLNFVFLLYQYRTKVYRWAGHLVFLQVFNKLCLCLSVVHCHSFVYVNATEQK